MDMEWQCVRVRPSAVTASHLGNLKCACSLTIFTEALTNDSLRKRIRTPPTMCSWTRIRYTEFDAVGHAVSSLGFSACRYIYFDNLKINKGLCVDGLDPPPPPPPSPPPSPPQEPLITDPVGTTAAVAIPPIVTSPPPKAGLGLHTQSGIATPCNASLAAGAVGTSELSNHGCLTGSSAGNSSTPSENTTTAVSPAEAPISANNVRGEAANNTSNGVEEISFSPLKEVMFVTGSISIVTTLLISFN